MQAKVVLCGEGFVGKSTIRERYLGISFRSSYLQTIGADYATKNQEYEPGKSLRLQIWDLAGQQKFSNIREAFYKGTDGAILIYDVSNPSTADKINDWINEILKVVQEPIPMILVGNKNDLRSEMETLSMEEGFKLAQQLSKDYNMNLQYIDTSAKTGENIEEIFQTLTKNIVNFDIQSSGSETPVDEAFDKYFNEVKNHIHLYFFKMTPIGPNCISQTDFPKDEMLLVKMAVFYSTTLGQGKSEHNGMFGPLPIPDSEDTKYAGLESLVYSFNKADKNHHDPRAKGINFCFIVVSVAKDLIFQFNNINTLQRFFHSQINDLADVSEITDDFLSKLKRDLLADVFIHASEN